MFSLKFSLLIWKLMRGQVLVTTGQHFKNTRDRLLLIMIGSKLVRMFFILDQDQDTYMLLSIFFGMSAFAYKILNIWSILICSYIVIKTLQKLNCSNFLSFFAGALILSIYTADNFRWLLMVGLSEYYAMLCLMIALGIIINKHHLSTIDYLLVVFLGIVQVWLREEHVPAVIGLIFLLKLKDTMTYKTKRQNYFTLIIKYIVQRKILILSYSFLILCGFYSIFIRNYFVGGSLGIFDITAVKTLMKNESIFTTYYHVFSRLIFGVDQYFPTLPKIYSVFNVMAIIFLFIIFNFRKFKNFSLGLPIF